MIRWAVSGTGSMAGLFLQDSQYVEQAEFVAVYSQSSERARQFAEQYQLRASYSDYERMLSDPDIDAVYIASTHEKHAQQAILALNAGKHVLIEKPMSLSQQEAREVFTAAEKHQRYCAEALWTKFNPTFQSVMNDIAAGRIGELRHIQASFGFATDLSNVRQRLLNPDYAGGALLDIGIYPIMLALTLFGLPHQTQAQIRFGATGVDIAGDLLLSYDDQCTASLSYRFDAFQSTKAVLSGSKGWVELEAPWFASRRACWKIGDDSEQWEDFAVQGAGWSHELQAVCADIAAGRLSSSQHTPEQSLQLMQYLQQIRDQYGPRYPFE